MRRWAPLLILVAGCIPRGQAPWIHADATVVDGRSGGPAKLPALVQGGVDVQVLSVKASTSREALEAIEAIRGGLGPPAGIAIARSASEIGPMQAQGRVAVLLALDGAAAIEMRLPLLSALRETGVRIVAPGAPAGAGLSAFGRDLVRELNRLGMVVDAADLPEPAFWDVLELSDAPVIVTRAASRFLNEDPRALTDAQIRAVAARGGIVCVSLRADRLDSRQVDPPADLFIDHVLHVLRIAGPDHVGIAGGFHEGGTHPSHLDDSASLPRIAELLLARGQTRETIQGILGGNLMRVFRRVLRD